MRVYQNKRRMRLRAELINMAGGKCVICGSDENLQFDHIDPSTKLFSIMNGLDRRREVLIAELKKCQLLCYDHHLEKTKSDPQHPNVPRGERVSCSKLTEDDVRVIRSSSLSDRDIAKVYDVTPDNIVKVRLRKTWRHVE